MNSATAGTATITNINSGTNGTVFFNSSTAGSAQIVNNAGGRTDFRNASTAGTATITNNTGGLTTFSFASSAQNATINNVGGVTSFNSASRASRATITNNAGGISEFLETANAGSATIANIDGSTVFGGSSEGGNAIITNGAGGTTTFKNNSSAGFQGNLGLGGSAITNNSGGLTQFFDTSGAGLATIINNSGGMTKFQDNSFGSGATITNNSGITEFLNNSTANSATIINNGLGEVNFRNTAHAVDASITNNAGSVTRFFDTSSAGTAIITTNSDGRTLFLDDSTGGDARLITNAGGRVDFGLHNPGAVTVGSIEGAGNYDLGSINLITGSNNLSTAVSGVIDGTGSLTKTGTGTLTLSGANTYTGGTIVNAGTLVVNGLIATSSGLTINGATLGGTGTVPSLILNNGSILAPGNSIGTLNVAGNVTFGAGMTYQVEANPAGQSDKIAATGRATINGGTVQVLAQNGTYNPSTNYTILTAAQGVGGTFSNVTSNLAFLTPSLSYTATTAVLTLALNTSPPSPPTPSPPTPTPPPPAPPPLTGLFTAVAQTPNQFATARALEAGTVAAPLTIAILNQSVASARQAFDALSGEIHASLQTALVDDSRYPREAILGRLRQAPYVGRSDTMGAFAFAGPVLATLDGAEPALGYAATTKKAAFPVKAPVDQAPPAATSDLTFWAHGYGAWGRFDGDGNAAELKRDLGGFLLGVDRRFTDNWWAGLAAGYSHARINDNGRASSANVDTSHVAGYTGGSLGSVNLRGGAAYAWHDLDTSRSILFPGFTDRASASYNGSTTQVFGEAGYGMSFGTVAAEPFAGLAWVHLDTGSFIETGGVAALAGSGNSFDVGYSTLGLRVATTHMLQNGMMLSPRASVAWQHAFSDITPAAAVAFQSTGASFGIAGVPLARDSALVEAGLQLRLNRQATLGFSYIGQLASNLRDNGVKGDFSWKF